MLFLETQLTRKEFFKEQNQIDESMLSGWPSGLRRCVQVAVYSCRRGFESHF